MAKKVEDNRRYDSSYRQAQARQTRKAITEAARKLFIEHGYAGATIGAIARDAGVSAETIYASFGSKKAILSHLVTVLVVGDDEPMPLWERPQVKATEVEPDQHKQILMFAGQMDDIMGRMAPIFEVMRTAAKTEPDIAEMHKHMLEMRLQGMTYFVRSVAAHGDLRAGLSIEEAAAIVFALSSGEMFNVFRTDLGWSSDMYKTWLADALAAALLPKFRQD